MKRLVLTAAAIAAAYLAGCRRGEVDDRFQTIQQFIADQHRYRP